MFRLEAPDSTLVASTAGAGLCWLAFLLLAHFWLAAQSPLTAPEPRLVDDRFTIHSPHHIRTLAAQRRPDVGFKMVDRFERRSAWHGEWRLQLRLSSIRSPQLPSLWLKQQWRRDWTRAVSNCFVDAWYRNERLPDSIALSFLVDARGAVLASNARARAELPAEFRDCLSRWQSSVEFGASPLSEDALIVVSLRLLEPSRWAGEDALEKL